MWPPWDSLGAPWGSWGLPGGFRLFGDSLKLPLAPLPEGSLGFLGIPWGPQEVPRGSRLLRLCVCEGVCVYGVCVFVCTGFVCLCVRSLCVCVYGVRVFVRTAPWGLLGVHFYVTKSAFVEMNKCRFGKHWHV